MLNLSPYKQKWSEEIALDKVKALVPRDFLMKCIELARPYYKIAGYHNFTHALQAATYLISHANKSGLSGWFAMLMHDAHWSKTDDRHNVVASMYRAIKLNRKHNLGFDENIIVECIASTTFYNGSFMCTSSTYFEEVHTADLLGGTLYDTWTNQFEGLCTELGRPLDLAALSDNYKFLSYTRADRYMLDVYLSYLSGVICELAVREVMRKRHSLLTRNLHANHIVMSDFLVRIIGKNMTKSNPDVGKTSLFGMDITIGQEDTIKVGYYE